MIEERPDDAMVEIGDPEEDSPVNAPEPPPRVVIEYRDRGIPWMLLPPLIAASAVVAVVVALNLNAKWNPRRPPSVAVQPVEPSLDGPTSASPQVADDALSPLKGVPDPVVVENLPNVPTPAEKPKPVADAPIVVATPAPAPPTAPNPEPAPTELVPSTASRAPDAVMFDLDAINNRPTAAESGTTPAPVDRDLAVVTQEAPGGAPGSAVTAPELPDQVDSSLLPPDPRKAMVDRRQRTIVARRKLEEERLRFHADLTQVIRQNGKRSAPAIHGLCQEYSQEIPIEALEQAKLALGKTGHYAGASMPERIRLIRALGFPEPKILASINDIESRLQSSSARNALGRDELYVQSAMILLNNPPNQTSPPRTQAAAAAQPRANFATRPQPTSPMATSPGP